MAHVFRPHEAVLNLSLEEPNDCRLALDAHVGDRRPVTNLPYDELLFGAVHKVYHPTLLTRVPDKRMSLGVSETSFGEVAPGVRNPNAHHPFPHARKWDWRKVRSER